MRVLVIVSMIGVCALLTSCGQKYPDAYGIYIKNGTSWIPVKPSGEALDISSQPEFLVADSRLAHLSDKPDTFVSISPVRWVRWNIKALVAKKGAEPTSYAKTKVETFVQVEPPRVLVYSPPNKRQDMLIVTSPTPLSNGYYWFTIFGDKVLCKLNVPSDKNQLDAQHVLDLWSTVFDESAGFSWDAFLVATGAMQQDAKYGAPQKLETLIQALRAEIDVCANASDIVPFVALCKKVRHLDDDLYNAAQSRCVTAIEQLSSGAVDRDDYPTAIGICALATNANMASARITSTLSAATEKLTAIEQASMEKCKRLEMDRRGIGKTLSSIPSFSGNHMFPGDKFTITVTETHVEFSHDDDRVWLAYISSVSPYVQANIRGTDYKVIINERYGHDHSIVFDTKEEQMKCCDAISSACLKWKTKWRNDLVAQVTARPHYWSERIYLHEPHDVHIVDPNNPSVFIPYNPRDDRFPSEMETGPQGDWCRFRSSTTNALTLHVRYSPSVFWSEDAEREKHADELASKEVAAQAAKVIVGTWTWDTSTASGSTSADLITYAADGSGDWSPENGRPGKFSWALDGNLLKHHDADTGKDQFYRVEKVDASEIVVYGIRSWQIKEGGLDKFRKLGTGGDYAVLKRKS